MSWMAPECLIAPNAKLLKCDEHIAKRLSEIDKELVIVCTSGPLREGKSYLMNRLAKFLFIKNKLPECLREFGVSPTRDALTKGFWVWYIDHPSDNNKGFLLVDIEGLGDTTDAAYDDCLLCLALLLGSVFVYNISNATISRQLIDKLDFVKVSEEIHLQSYPKNGRIPDDPFPVLVLSLRNAHLDGNGETDDEYMEARLRKFCAYESVNRVESVGNDENGSAATNQGSSQMMEDTSFNREEKIQVKKITDYFVIRKCFMFPLPSDEPKDTHVLTDDQLNAEFVCKLNSFCNYILSCAPVKLLYQKPINGKIFIALLHRYLQHVEQFGFLCPIGDNVNIIVENHNKFFVQKSITKFKHEMKNKIVFPTATNQLRDEALNCVERTVNYFIEKAYHDGRKEHYTNLKEHLVNEFCKIEEENRTLSSDECVKLLNEMFDRYQNVFIVKKEYEQTSGKGAMAELEWNKFVLSKIQATRETANETAQNFSVVRIAVQEKTYEKELENQTDQLNKSKRKIMKSIGDILTMKISNEYEKKGRQLKDDYNQLIKELVAQEKRLKEEEKLLEAPIIRQQIEELERKKKSVLQSIREFLSKLAQWLSQL